MPLWLAYLASVLWTFAVLTALSQRTAAHPHVWITVETTVLYQRGAFIGLKHKWTFDESYTAMAIEGLDKNRDRVYDRNELSELAKVNVDGLKEFQYFTYPSVQGKKLKLGDARDYWLEHKNGVLSLYFTVPFAQPVLGQGMGFAFVVQDPTYFIAFELAGGQPIKLANGAPAACTVSIAKPDSKSDDAQRPGDALGQVEPTISYAQKISVACP
jgi:ABC-type uncharacterized transport system substrate-binding protein